MLLILISNSFIYELHISSNNEYLFSTNSVRPTVLSTKFIKCPFKFILKILLELNT